MLQEEGENRKNDQFEDRTQDLVRNFVKNT